MVSDHLFFIDVKVDEHGRWWGRCPRCSLPHLLHSSEMTGDVARRCFPLCKALLWVDPKAGRSGTWPRHAHNPSIQRTSSGMNISAKWTRRRRKHGSTSRDRSFSWQERVS